ncbi:MAG: MFS transporter [bacterium]
MNLKKSKQTTRLSIIFAVVCIDLIGFGIVLPLLPLYAKSYGASPVVIGVLAVSYSLGQLLFNPLWGSLSDRIGRRPVLLGSLLGSAIFYTLFGWAPSLAWLFVARTCAGVFAANISTAMAYISDITTKADRAKGMGLIGAAFALGFIIGPAVGGFLSKFSYHWPGYGAAVLSFIALILAMAKLPESLTEPRKERPLWSAFGSFIEPIMRNLSKPEVARPIWVYFLIILAFSCMQLTFPLFTHEVFNFDVVENGYLFAFVGVLAVVLQGGLIDRLSKRFGAGPLALVGTALGVVGMACFPFAKSLRGLLVLLALLGIGTGLSTPTLTSLVSINAEESEQGAVLGVSRSIATLARILGPLWGGWAYGLLGINWTYWSAGGVLLLALWVGLPLLRVRPGYRKVQPAETGH